MHWADENIIIKEKLLTDNGVVKEQDSILFWLSEAPFSKDSLLGYEEREESEEKSCLDLENSFVAESPCRFPLQNIRTESDTNLLLTQNLSPLNGDPSPIVSTPESIVLDGNFFLSYIIIIIVIKVGFTLKRNRTINLICLHELLQKNN